MNYPQISVLTPTFNRSKFLPLFIHNLKQQTYPHNKIEVIIDDDIYNPAYIVYSYNTLKDGKYGLVGSNAMIFCYPEKEFKTTSIQCEHKVQIHEATMCYTKKYWKSMGGYVKNSKGEGVNMIQEQNKNVGLTEILLCMICVAHDGNTVDKEQFNFDTDQSPYEGTEVGILKQILSIK